MNIDQNTFLYLNQNAFYQMIFPSNHLILSTILYVSKMTIVHQVMMKKIHIKLQHCIINLYIIHMLNMSFMIIMLEFYSLLIYYVL